MKAVCLTRSQCFWLGFCLTGIILTNSINWTAFARISMGQYNKNALSWMFRHSKIAWEHLFHFSLDIIFKAYKITKGVIDIDDTDKKPEGEGPSGYLTKTLESIRATCAAFWKVCGSGNFPFYFSFWGLKARPLSSPFSSYGITVDI